MLNECRSFSLNREKPHEPIDTKSVVDLIKITTKNKRITFCNVSFSIRCIVSAFVQTVNHPQTMKQTAAAAAILGGTEEENSTETFDSISLALKGLYMAATIQPRTTDTQQLKVTAAFHRGPVRIHSGNAGKNVHIVAGWHDI